jgi:hypothetical protein
LKLDHKTVCHPSSERDNLSPRILKELAAEISPLLQLIYTKSLDTGEVPADWRTVNVSPVYKKHCISGSIAMHLSGVI